MVVFVLPLAAIAAGSLGDAALIFAAGLLGSIFMGDAAGRRYAETHVHREDSTGAPGAPGAPSAPDATDGVDTKHPDATDAVDTSSPNNTDRAQQPRRLSRRL